MVEHAIPAGGLSEAIVLKNWTGGGYNAQVKDGSKSYVSGSMLIPTLGFKKCDISSAKISAGDYSSGSLTIKSIGTLTVTSGNTKTMSYTAVDVSNMAEISISYSGTVDSNYGYYSSVNASIASIRLYN